MVASYPIGGSGVERRSSRLGTSDCSPWKNPGASMAQGQGITALIPPSEYCNTDGVATLRSFRLDTPTLIIRQNREMSSATPDDIGNSNAKWDHPCVPWPPIPNISLGIVPHKESLVDSLYTPTPVRQGPQSPVLRQSSWHGHQHPPTSPSYLLNLTVPSSPACLQVR